MGGIIEYLRGEGGRTPFAGKPPNDVDYLVFAQLAYCDFLPAASLAGRPFREAVAALPDARSADKSEERFKFQLRDDNSLLAAAAACERYRDVLFAGFFRVWDAERAIQFAALAVDLPCHRLLAYRGTDNTLAGWKEDFDLCCRMPVPAQEQALAFALLHYADYPGDIALCGHSKGGNLALYAALNLPENAQGRLLRAVSFDGPGMPEPPPARAISQRLRVLLPEGSLIGVLFPQPAAVRTVRCRGVSVLQHYPYLWLVEDGDFIDGEQSFLSAGAAKAMAAFLRELPVAERARFIELAYDIVRSAKADTLLDLLRGMISNTPKMARALGGKINRENALLYGRVLSAFFKAVGEAAGLKKPPVT